ncbi:MAG: DUF1796 family putative cysteine peptidase [Victivallaceae bacterium]|nr:DUF1796 family putative cysteine peptidase [Victivallaceae bacterium]
MAFWNFWRKRKKIDLAFGIGAVCSCSETLRRAKLQTYSYPFDWVGYISIACRLDFLLGDASKFLPDPEDWISRNCTNGDTRHLCDVYYSRVNGMAFNHEVPAGVAVADALMQLRRKYVRRFDRLRSQLSAARKVLVVYLEPPTEKALTQSDEVLEDAVSRLEKAYPQAQFELLYIYHAEDVPLSKKAERMLNGRIRIVGFEYKSRKKDAPPHAVDFKLMRKFLRDYKITSHNTEQ